MWRLAVGQRAAETRRIAGDGRRVPHCVRGTAVEEQSAGQSAGQAVLVAQWSSAVEKRCVMIAKACVVIAFSGTDDEAGDVSYSHKVQ